MQKLHTSTISHIFPEKSVYVLNNPKGGYLLFKTKDDLAIKVGDAVSFFDTQETQSMYYIPTGESFSGVIELKANTFTEIEKLIKYL